MKEFPLFYLIPFLRGDIFGAESRIRVLGGVMKKKPLAVCIAVAFVFPFLLPFPASGAPVADPFRLEESLERELAAAARRGIWHLASLQKENGAFSEDPVFDRRIAALIGAFSGEEADLKAVLRKHRPPKGPVRAGKKTVPDAEPEYWRELFELVRTLRKTENSPLFPKGFRSWRRDVAERLLETQNRNGAWGDACGTFYALCAIRLISGFDS